MGRRKKDSIEWAESLDKFPEMSFEAHHTRHHSVPPLHSTLSAIREQVFSQQVYWIVKFQSLQLTKSNDWKNFISGNKMVLSSILNRRKKNL